MSDGERSVMHNLLRVTREVQPVNGWLQTNVAITLSDVHVNLRILQNAPSPAFACECIVLFPDVAGAFVLLQEGTTESQNLCT